MRTRVLMRITALAFHVSQQTRLNGGTWQQTSRARAEYASATAAAWISGIWKKGRGGEDVPRW